MIHSTEHYFSPGMSVPQCPLLHGHDGKPLTRPTPGDVSQPNNTHLSQTRGCHRDGMRDEQGSLRCQTGIWKMDPWWKSVPIRIMCSVVWLMVSCEYYLFTFDKYDIFMQYVSQKKIWAKNAQPFLLLYEDFLCGYYCTLVAFSSLFLCPPFLLMSTHPLSDHLPYGPITDVHYHTCGST